LLDRNARVTTVKNSTARTLKAGCGADELQSIFGACLMYVGWAIPSPNGKYLALWQASGNSNVWMVEKF
jgi:hypothetical protein